MRLFTAIEFDGQVRDSLCNAAEALRPHTVSGNFTERANMHLTLVFLGEHGPERLPAICAAMKTAGGETFTLTLGSFGTFGGGEGRTCWVGMEHSPALTALQASLARSLKRAGFGLEERKYTPHVTLARRVTFAPGFDWRTMGSLVPAAVMDVTGISLMESRRVNGRLVYERVYHAELKI